MEQQQTAAFAVDPFRLPGGQSPLTSYGLVDWLRGPWPSDRMRCAAGAATLDHGRRAVRSVVGAPPACAVGPVRIWPLTTGVRRPGEGEAAFHQFQAQIGDLVDPLRGLPQSQLTAVNARSFCRYLPPAGLIPLSEAGRRGFNYSNFFFELNVAQPVIIAVDVLSRYCAALSAIRPSFAERDQRLSGSIWCVKTWMPSTKTQPLVQHYLIFARLRCPTWARLCLRMTTWSSTGLCQPARCASATSLRYWVGILASRRARMRSTSTARVRLAFVMAAVTRGWRDHPAYPRRGRARYTRYADGKQSDQRRYLA